MGVVQQSRGLNSPVLNRYFVQEGDYIFREGAPGDKAFIVQDGAVEIFKHKREGEVLLGTVATGGIFGEMSLIDDKPRMASARASKPSTLIVIGRGMFTEKLANCDPFLSGLMKILAGNIRMLSDAVAGNHELGVTDEVPIATVAELAAESAAREATVASLS